jgi:hypothetical protein
VLVIVLLALSAGVGPRAPTPTSAFTDSHLTTPPCPGATLPHNYSGSVEINRAPTVAPVSVTYSYWEAVVTTLSDGVVTSSVCSSVNGTTVTGTEGHFALAIVPTPIENCTAGQGGRSGQCINTTGPFELVSVAPSDPNPPGFYSTDTQNGTNFTVEISSYLATVSLHPAGPAVTFSPGGTDELRADPLTGAGTPTPGGPQFAWTVSGVGWTFLGSSHGSEVNVTAAPGAGIGNLTVAVSVGPSEGNLVDDASLELLAVSTSISAASLNRTVVDVGQSVGAVVTGSGAAGYAYSGSIRPGLGAPSVAAACSSSPGASGMVVISCAATLNFTAVGIAQPVITVSNGDSSAMWVFPDVTVDPAPSIAFFPGAPVGYANTSVAVTVEVGAGTGTAPYAEGCLSSGVGAPDCIASPGPSWAFAPVYSTPGRYTATAWAVDATGVNRSATTTVRVVAPLHVAWSTNSTVGAAGTPIELAAVVSGGDLPARVWWNATGASDPVATQWVTTDGTVRATFVPSAAGFVTISVAVADGLGSAVGASQAWTIQLGVAASVVPVVLPSASSARAGTPVAIAWQAVDAAGEAVRDFSSTAEIELAITGSGQADPGWVNASGVGPLPSRLPGWFDVPGAAWLAGSLNVTVTTTVAASVEVDLVVATGLAARDDSLGLFVLPDIDQLRLSDPHTPVAGARTNDTLWQVTDRFGNPAYGASVIITTAYGGSVVRAVVPVVDEPGGATAVWTNFTAPGSSAGTVTVTDLAGDLLLPTIAVPGLVSSTAPLVAALTVIIAVGVGGAVGTTRQLRNRRPRSSAADGPVDEELELQRLAEGRAEVVEIVRRNGPLDLSGLVALWDRSPVPADLADWVASLLTDGTLDATLGDDGVARFCLPAPPRAEAQITFDVAAFESAQLRRDAETTEGEPDPSP